MDKEEIRKMKESLDFDPDASLPFEDMKYIPAPMLSMKTDKELYFTPEIEDIRVGYELEWKLQKQDWIEYGDKSVHDWHPHTITQNDFHGGELGDDFHSFGNMSCEFRVPYLTKEQIEKEGWLEGSKGLRSGSKSILSMIKNNYVVMYVPIDRYLSVYDKAKDIYIYQGECKDINTFRYICKLLGI